MEVLVTMKPFILLACIALFTIQVGYADETIKSEGASDLASDDKKVSEVLPALDAILLPDETISSLVNLKTSEENEEGANPALLSRKKRFFKKGFGGGGKKGFGGGGKKGFGGGGKKGFGGFKKGK